MPKRQTTPWVNDPRSWYQLERWRRIRRLHLKHNPLCSMCAAKGQATAATVADHIVPHEGNWNEFLIGKLQSLCGHHHNSDKRFEDLNGFKRPTFGPDGWPIEDATAPTAHYAPPSTLRAKPPSQG